MNRLLAPLRLSARATNTRKHRLIPTPEVDLAYETYGAAGNTTPVIVANGTTEIVRTLTSRLQRPIPI